MVMKPPDCLIVPWTVHEYPGAWRMLAAIWGVSEGTVQEYMKPSYEQRFPVKHALRLAHDLESRAAACEALARELRDYAERKTPIVKRGTRAERHRRNNLINPVDTMA